MNSHHLLFVFLGGGTGCCVRYLIGMIQFSNPKYFMVPTFFINILASLFLGFLMSRYISNPEKEWIRTLLMVGFCGGFSTFSTFSFENFLLIKNGDWALALGYAVLSVLVCLIAVSAGYLLSK
ncbi:MAG: CrcB family protein [Saprospiraceae bacterium]|nr:CrcB family protein [Candidatus Vicinibacter affinis]MBP6172900.1 CrcB family protein [Saprospiraceae bacterium]MBK6572978.1 CrcB family protein [Candidatus Vicinibacter affinis]MBK6822545.1 CrcB family protein [Candidatus Vicinibacter affinis]MBK7301668.1 CrcB family protein [Candidatus Vicinibacter affinis]